MRILFYKKKFGATFMVAPSYIIAMTIRPVYPEPTGRPGYALYGLIY